MITDNLQYIWLNVNSRFRCVLLLTLWDAFLLMQCFIHHIHKLLRGLSCLHKDIFLKTDIQVSFTTAIFLLLFHDMRNAYAFSSVLHVVQRSHNTDLFHVSASCHIVLRKNTFQQSNHLVFPMRVIGYCVYYVTQYLCMSLSAYVCLLMIYYVNWKFQYLNNVNPSKILRLWAFNICKCSWYLHSLCWENI